MDVVFLYDRPDVPSNRKATRNISGRNAGNRRISVPGRLLEVWSVGNLTIPPL